MDATAALRIEVEALRRDIAELKRREWQRQLREMLIGYVLYAVVIAAEIAALLVLAIRSGR